MRTLLGILVGLVTFVLVVAGAEALSGSAQPRSFPRNSSLSCAGFALPPVAFMT